MNLLETDFDYGRRQVLGGLQHNFALEFPTSTEYQLLNDFFCGATPPNLWGTPDAPYGELERVCRSALSDGRLVGQPGFRHLVRAE